MEEGHVICTACLVESTCSTPVRRPDRRCCWHYLQVLHTGAIGTSAGRSRGTCALRAVQGQPSREVWGACRSLQLGAVQARCVPLLSRLVLSLPRNHLAVIARLLDLRFWIGAKPPQGKKGRERRLVLVLAPVLVLGPPPAPSHFFPSLAWFGLLGLQCYLVGGGAGTGTGTGAARQRQPLQPPDGLVTASTSDFAWACDHIAGSASYQMAQNSRLHFTHSLIHLRPGLLHCAALRWILLCSALQ